MAGLGLALYSRLSGYYFYYYGILGLLLPYFTLWMADRGLSPAQMGLVLAAHGVSRILLPPLWGALADVSGQRLRIIQVASLLSAIGIALLPLAHSFATVLGAMLLFSLFWNATMPQFEAYTLGTLAERGGDYSRVRLWGSVGFVLAVVGGGAGFERVGIDWLPATIVVALLAMTAAAFALPGARTRLPPSAQDESLWGVLRRPVVIALLVACMLHQLSFAPYYGFFSLYLEQTGWGKTAIGLLWAFGVICEIVVFVWTGRIIHRFGLRAVFLAAMLSTVVRWVGLEFVIDWLPGLLLLQALHLSSFGLYHACAVQFIQREFRGRLQGRGQALHVSLSFGVGGSVGAALSGAMWEVWGPEPAYRMAALAAFAATLISWRWLR